MKEVKTLKKILIVVLMLILIGLPIRVYAYDEIKLAAVINPDDFNPGNIENAFNGAEKITNIGATLISIIRVIGIIVTVISLIVLGMKYMTGSIQEKADYQKSMIPFLIGILIFFALSQFIPIIINFSSTLNS